VESSLESRDDHFLPESGVKCSWVRDEAGDVLCPRTSNMFTSTVMSTSTIRSHRLRDLSPARRRLIELMQTINFGRIEDLWVRESEPVLDPPPRALREVKFASETGSRPETRLTDFALRDQHRDLFELLDEIGDGVVSRLIVKHGLPFHAELPC